MWLIGSFCISYSTCCFSYTKSFLYKNIYISDHSPYIQFSIGSEANGHSFRCIIFSMLYDGKYFLLIVKQRWMELSNIKNQSKRIKPYLYMESHHLVVQMIDHPDCAHHHIESHTYPMDNDLVAPCTVGYSLLHPTNPFINPIADKWCSSFFVFVYFFYFVLLYIIWQLSGLDCIVKWNKYTQIF